MDGHVVGDAIFRSELGDPEAPGDIAAGIRNAVDNGAGDQTGKIIAEEEGEDAYGESEVQDNAEGEKVCVVEESAPERAKEDTGDIRDDAGEESDFADR